MGTKEKKRKHADSSSSSSDEERHHKKHKKAKKDKKDSKEKKRLVSEAKKLLKKQLKAEKEDTLDANAEIPMLSQDSYFERNPEFTQWLKDDKGVYFSDLPTTEARAFFEEFVSRWNSRQLKKLYYTGISATQARRSHHSWGFKGQGVEATKLGMAAAMEEEREAQANERAADKMEQRRWKQDQKLLLDEMLPKATGREATVEKRQIRREEAKAREASPDITNLPGGGDIYGNDDSFQAARAREAQRGARTERQAAWKTNIGAARLHEAQAKEDAAMAQFTALAARGPITIAKRQ